MTTARLLRYSYEDYLRALDDSELKLEYCAGVIYAMAGGTLAHAELSVAVATALKEALAKGCSVHSSDAKVRVESSDFAGFPDVSVVCGERQTSRIDPNALVNPVLLLDVTSRSTEDSDRDEKLKHSQRLPSVGAVLFVSHREPRVTLETPKVDFAVDDVYRGVTLDP